MSVEKVKLIITTFGAIVCKNYIEDDESISFEVGFEQQYRIPGLLENFTIKKSNIMALGETLIPMEFDKLVESMRLQLQSGLFQPLEGEELPKGEEIPR